jgi:hypothetical protein
MQFIGMQSDYHTYHTLNQDNEEVWQLQTSMDTGFDIPTIPTIPKIKIIKNRANYPPIQCHSGIYNEFAKRV